MSAAEFEIHAPSFQSIVLATRGVVRRRPASDPVRLSTDTRAALADACFVALRGERFDGHGFVAEAAARGAALAVVEQVPDEAVLAALPEGFGLLEVASTRAALGAIAHAWRTSLRRLRVAAVTGSAGKTTTRRLLEGALSAAGRTHASPKSFNNDVGVPLTLLSTPDDAAFLVAEIGMNHPGEILPLARLADPEVAVITLAGRAHLEGLGSVEAVATEKASILSAVAAHGAGVVNGDNPPLLAAVERLAAQGAAPARIVRFGWGSGCDYRLLERTPTADGQSFEFEVPVRIADREGGNRRHRLRIRMSGEHNARNALAAAAAALEMGLDLETIARGIAEVDASDMRLERLGIGPWTVYNDAYNANPDAMIAALGAFAELGQAAPARAAILGEMRELGPDARALHEEVGRAAAARLDRGDLLVAVGPHARALCDAARGAGFEGAALAAETFDEAFADTVAARLPAPAAVLLKGSRGARMERFLVPLERAAAAGGASGR
jgi:UDP-N-acetylmuramoyl-tripeptide--D-alanyl-D-alanine ligase